MLLESEFLDILWGFVKGFAEAGLLVFGFFKACEYVAQAYGWILSKVSKK